MPSIAEGTLVKTTRPQVEVCGTCRRNVFYKDYIYVLVEAGVDANRIMDDLLLPEGCCKDNIVTGLPIVNREAVERLSSLKSLVLEDPPEFYQRRQGDEVRPVFIPNIADREPTSQFVGAEPYYYLMERGENPNTVLDKLAINDEGDRDAILKVTDRAQSDFECLRCGESLPHYKLLSFIYKKRGYDQSAYIEEPQRITRECCVSSVVSHTNTAQEDAEAESYLESHVLSSGIALDLVPFEQCMTCGSTRTQYYKNYAWLTHRGIPNKTAMDYFGLNNICCRSATINPRQVVRESRAKIERRLKQQAEIPDAPRTNFDYSSQALPKLSGSLLE